MTYPASPFSPSTSTINDMHDFPDPPSSVSLANAKFTLTEHAKSLEQLSGKITEAEAHLAQIVLEAQCAINEMTREKSLIEEKISRTQSYLAPIRRLPSELLSYVFNWCFQDHPCCAWILAAVCRKWRRLALNMPRIWSKIRLLTTQHSSPDIIRLWLERAGPTVPLDIEIYLRVVKSSPDASPKPRIRSRRSTSPNSPAALFYSTWSAHHPVLPGGAGSSGPPVAHYVIPHPSTVLPPAHTPLIVPFASQPVTSIHDGWDPWIPSPPPSFAHVSLSHRDRRNNKYDRSSVNGPRNGNHWGWIAMFYLVEQIQRWERFVFRFDKHFNSIAALKSINGDAPLLKEFEVSSAEPAPMSSYQDCSWLPNLNFPPANLTGSSSQHVPALPQLQSLTLQNAPFKWSSPMFHTNLHTLNLRAHPNSQLSLDRVFHILHANRNSLKCLSLYFQLVTQTVLPLNPLLLPELTEFNIGGHHYLCQLVEILTLPSLEEFNTDIDARDPIEDIIAGLLTRMGPLSAGIKHLSVAYGYGCGRRATKDAQQLREKDGKSRLSNLDCSPSSSSYPASTGSSSFYYGTATVVSWAFLTDMNQLESLRIGCTPMDTLLSALGAPDDDLLSGSAAAAGVAVPGGSASNSWLCPNLSEVAMKHCHAHSEGIGRLVQFVDARNPDTNVTGTGSGAMVVNGVAPTRLASLELYECAVLGPDVLEWLKGRVDNVQVSELQYERLQYDRSSLSPY